MVNESQIKGLEFFDCKSDEPYFTWSTCDTCNSNLGGDRYDVRAKTKNGMIIELECCVDCVVDLCR